MRRINLSREQCIQNQDFTSRGNQPKWFVDGCWYKQDYMGYEGLAEVLASRLLACSNISEFAVYEPVIISVNGSSRPGCVSKSFKRRDESIIPVQKLYRLYTGENLAKRIVSIQETAERIKFLTDFVESNTDLDNFGSRLTAMLEFDAIILNEDRHFNNVSVIRSDSTRQFRLCPVFDNGISLLSDLISYPPDCDIYTVMKQLEAKPFDRDFLVQAEAAESIFGNILHMVDPRPQLSSWLSELSEYYSDEILRRAEDVLRSRLSKYF